MTLKSDLNYIYIYYLGYCTNYLIKCVRIGKISISLSLVRDWSNINRNNISFIYLRMCKRRKWRGISSCSSYQNAIVSQLSKLHELQSRLLRKYAGYYEENDDYDSMVAILCDPNLRSPFKITSKSADECYIIPSCRRNVVDSATAFSATISHVTIKDARGKNGSAMIPRWNDVWRDMLPSRIEVAAPGDVSSISVLPVRSCSLDARRLHEMPYGEERWRTCQKFIIESSVNCLASVNCKVEFTFWKLTIESSHLALAKSSGGYCLLTHKSTNVMFWIGCLSVR